MDGLAQREAQVSLVAECPVGIDRGHKARGLPAIRCSQTGSAANDSAFDGKGDGLSGKLLQSAAVSGERHVGKGAGTIYAG